MKIKSYTYLHTSPGRVNGKKRNSTDEKIRGKLFNTIKYNLKKVET